MKTNEILVVSGLARCGTSLMMSMLVAGGMSAYADARTSWETDKMLALPGESAWLEECRGKAVKILSPLDFTPPPGLPYRFIWMQRDYRQQARSMVKFLSMVGPGVQRGSISEFARSLERDTPPSLALLRSLGPVLVVRFEEVLKRPLEVAQQVAAYGGVPLDVVRMAGAVVPRSPKCLDGLLELSMLEGEA